MGRTQVTAVLIVGAALLCIWSMHNGQPELTDFQNWKQLHGIKYSTTLENDYRSFIFNENVKKIQAHNADPTKTYTMAVNQFAGITQEQFQNTYLAHLRFPERRHKSLLSQVYTIGADIDWVTLGAVTRVKTQGQCAASWAFSATGSLQGLYQIQNQQLKTFSDQQLLDCSGDWCSCQAGFVDMSFRYLQNHGLCEQTQYPYVQAKGACKNLGCAWKINDYDMADNCDDLGKAIAKQPIAVAVDASNWVFYNSGVFTNCATKINYMALLVGIVEGNWKVKNSLGPAWGEKGYIRLAPGNTCGICSIGLYPTK